MEIKNLIKRIRNKRNRIRVGYVYAPYITVQNISVFISGSSSRTKTIDSSLYSKITVKK